MWKAGGRAGSKGGKGGVGGARRGRPVRRARRAQKSACTTSAVCPSELQGWRPCGRAAGPRPSVRPACCLMRQASWERHGAQGHMWVEANVRRSPDLLRVARANSSSGIRMCPSARPLSDGQAHPLAAGPPASRGRLGLQAFFVLLCLISLRADIQS